MEEQKIGRKRKPLWRRVVSFSLLGVLTLLLLLFSTSAILLTPKRLTPIAMRLADNLFLADVRFDTLNVSLFQDFPYVNITINNGHIRSRAFDGLPLLLKGALPSGCDSLLDFEELSVSLHLKKLFNSEIDIRRVRLRNATVNAYISPLGIANWEVWESDTAATAPNAAPAFHLNLQRIIIRDGFRLQYRSAPDALSAAAQFERLFIRGDITLQPEDMKIETFSASAVRIDAQEERSKRCLSSSIDSVRMAVVDAGEERYSLFLQSHHSVVIDTIDYAQALPVALHGEFGFSFSRLDSLYIKDFTISAANIPIQLDGSFSFAAPQPRIRLNCHINRLAFAEIISLLPPSLIPQAQDIDTDIAAKIHATVDYPAYTFEVVTSGYLNYPPENAYIHTLALDATYAHHPDRPELSGLNVRQCDLEASGISLHAQGYVQNPMEDPDIDLSLQGNIQLDTLYRILPIPDNVTARGAISIDATAKVLWSDFLKGDLNMSTLRGRIEAERLLFRLPQDSILFMARTAHISFGANLNQRDSLIEQGVQMLRLSFRADSANIRYKQQFRLSMGSTRLSARSAASALDGDTTRIHPFNGSLETAYLSLQTADSMRVQLSEGVSAFSLLPAPHDPSLPVIAANLRALFFQMSDTENQYELLSPQIELHATRLPSARTQSDRQTRPRGASSQINTSNDSTSTADLHLAADSTLTADSAPSQTTTQQRPTRSDSLAAPNRPQRPIDEFASGDLALETDSETKRLLRQWQLEGTIQAVGGALSTLYFPLPVILGETDIEFNTDEIQLMQTEIQAGRSSIECTGKISNLRQVMLGRGNLGVYGFVRSDTLDINELMLAANAGSQYADSGIVVEELEEMSSLMIIPANLNLNLKLFSAYTRYGNEYLTDLSGSLTSQNRSLQINDLEASSSIGDFRLSALYSTRSRNNITAGFDLEMKKVQVARLISLIPSIDTLAPMLRSFEGWVDCQISATTSLDTEMNILLPTLKAACRIQGENMVLLDGETFTEISKMLQFTKRSQNLIDQVAVDFLIHDNQIEVFPFIFEMDRYRAAVSGIHNFDMSFDYHISILRSPVPFRLGIDITGTLDNLHFRLARCRYRDTNIPSYVELIDATRISLLEAIKAFDPATAFRAVERSVAQAARIEEEEEYLSLN